MGAMALIVLLLAACVGDAGARAPERSAPSLDGFAAQNRTAGPTEPVAWRQAPPGAMARLVGLDDASLLLLLGPPELKRREPPAEVWRYAGSGCALHLFLYQGPAGIYRVVHAEARSTGAHGDCLDRLIEARRPRPRSS